MKTDLFPHLLQPTCAQCAGIGINNIPDMLWDMEDACGPAGLFAFLHAHGGRQYSIPVREPKVRADMLLWRAEIWMFRRFGPGRVVVPLGPTAYRLRLAWTIYVLLSEGASLSEVCKKLHCDMRTVSGHKEKFRKINALK